jgi:tRNA/tmRNA/rRNA uracil-C5-methylase (TrmA/RlmC/RlmD family)
VVLIENASSPGAVTALREDLEKTLGNALHSVTWNGHPERSNAVVGPYWQPLVGPDTVIEKLRGVAVHFPPGAFGQSNLPLVDSMLDQIAEWVPTDARVAEFYAGCGAIGLGLLERGAEVCFNERSEDSLAGLERGLAELSSDTRARATLLPGDAGERPDAVQNASVVIVDPPRKGIDERLLVQLCETPPPLLISVSCGLDAFEREARALVTTGQIALRELVAYDLFPHTKHVETLARFERIDAPPA